MHFSVVTSVYKNDKPEFVMRSLDSITTLQTIRPDEVVLVIDGPISNALDKLIIEREKLTNNLYTIIRLPKNKGLGNALRVGVESAKYDIIARMDSDDISTSDRFEKQVNYLEKNSECDILGGQINEFIDEEENIVGIRTVPCNSEEINNYLKRRCPFNHVSVMFRKSAVQNAGGYLDWYLNEDYYLWIRMMESGCKFANLPDTLVKVRVGKDMYKRRGGWKYFKSEALLQVYMRNKHIITWSRFLYNVTGRFVIQLAMPNWLRGFVFQKLFRK